MADREKRDVDHAEQLLEELTRKGYLESVVEGCSAPASAVLYALPV